MRLRLTSDPIYVYKRSCLWKSIYIFDINFFYLFTDVSSPCTFCGKKGHGRIAPQDVRRTECPAYNSTCTACHKKHHFAAVCRGKNRYQQGDARPELQEGAVFDSLCVVNNINRRRDQRFIALDHHLYDQLSNSWLNQSSKPQPYMKLGVDVLVDDYKHFGFESLLTHPTRHNVHGRHRVPELPHEYQGDQSPRHQTTRVDSGNNEDARCKQGGHKHPRCRHLKVFRQNLKWNPGVSSDRLRHRCRQQGVPQQRGLRFARHYI